MYWKYFKYIVEHKWNVGIECFKIMQPIHAIFHDLSKFLPSEFLPYARFFMAKNRAKEYKQSDEDDPNFQKGWCLHQNEINTIGIIGYQLPVKMKLCPFLCHLYMLCK